MTPRTTMAALAGALLATACGGGGADGPGGTASGGTGAGTLSLSLTDNPCGHRAVHVTIDRVRVHASADAGEADAGWRDMPLALSPAQRRVDLLSLQNGVLLKLGDLSLEPGRYTQIRLVLAENSAANPAANAVTLADGAVVPLVTPSAQRSGIKLVQPFEIAAGQAAELTLDFDACRSIVVAGNSGRYSLKPTIAVIPMLDVGRIDGYAPQGSLVSAQRVGTDGAPVVVKATVAAADGSFRLAPLPASAEGTTYAVVATAPSRATLVIRSVPVVRQGTTALATAGAPLAAPAATTATLAGRIVPAGLDGAMARALQSIDGLRVEVAAANADEASGAYALAVPREAARVAAYPGAAPLPTAPALSFAPALPAGEYTVQAAAAGRQPVLSTPVTLPQGAGAPATVAVPDLVPR